MATSYERWHHRMCSRIDEYETLGAAPDEGRWRLTNDGDDAGGDLSLVAFDDAGMSTVIAFGDGLLRHARHIPTGD